MYICLMLNLILISVIACIHTLNVLYCFRTCRDGTIDVREFEALWKYVQEWRNCFERYAHASMHAYRYIHTCTRAAFRGRGHFPAELSLAPLAHPFAC